MAAAVADQTALSRGLVSLLDLSRRARAAGTEPELAFLLVNETRQLIAYRQAALWQASNGVKFLSGLVQPESNAPYVHWLGAVCRYLALSPDKASGGGTTRSVTAADLPAALAKDWTDWFPQYGLWLPMPAEAGAPAAALLLGRDQPWSEGEVALASEWCAIWWHALQAFRVTRRRFFGRRPRAASSVAPRSWFRLPLRILALLGVAALALPVRLSVLSPGELTPRDPVVVRAPLEGVIDVFHVQPNQAVSKGQPLFGFDEAIIQSRLDVANQALMTANAEYRQTMQQALGDARVRTQIAALSGRIEEKRSEVAFLQEQLTRARVLAPRDGVVLFDDPTDWIGKPVAIGERILRIAVATDVEVEAWLSIADAIVLEPGANVSLYLNASPLEPVVAKLRYVAHDATQRPDGAYAYRLRATLVGPTIHRVGLKGTVRAEGEKVSVAYWVMRRPIATLRTTLGL